MLVLKWLLMMAGYGLLACAAAVLIWDAWVALGLTRLLFRRREPEQSSSAALAALPTSRTSALRPMRLQLSGKFLGAACLAMLLASSLVVIPDGYAGVRVSQISGVRPGTLYAGAHFLTPLLESVASYDIRDRVYETKATATAKIPGELLIVEAREGLSLGVSVSVRYRLEPQRLAYIHANVPQPIEQQDVAPVVMSTFRDFAAGYVVRDVFTARREEFRQRASEAITQRLAQDGILVKEVLLRDVQLPPEYAKGLESLLLEEQESERLGFETDIKQKQVKIAELEAEADKVRSIKGAEAAAQVHVLQAKGESDSMQYTLPLKQKQIEQAKLEAEARKQETIENAQAAAESKVIDGKAELERGKLLAEAEANRIRVTAAANSERLNLEAAALKANPMLIQKIVAERLSDKVQIIMVPMDGKNFFAGDVLRSAFNSPQSDPDNDRPKPAVGMSKPNN
jgi:regulator of protease activity HflC (stomatin/prohibitin superfamily)